MKREIFGAMPDGREACLYTLEGDGGVVVKITDFGGIIVSMRTPDRHGKPGEIGLGFDSLGKYVAINDYFGALIGRVGNRIGHGKFSLDGVDYQLNTNNGAHHLHGGKVGFNARLWESAPDGDKLRLEYVSPNGEENYPGTLFVKVWYSLVGKDLRIEYEAATDKATPVNLTNHAYFNLNCYTTDILNHELRIQADAYNPVNDSLIPTGEIRPVVDTPFDFTVAKPVGRDIDRVPGGYDHNFLFTKQKPDLEEWLIEAYDPDTGRTLSMATTEPGAQFYTGNFLDGALVGHDGRAYKKRYGFCLEAQRPPDAVNHPNFVSTILRPGETYRQTTVYRFGTRA